LRTDLRGLCIRSLCKEQSTFLRELGRSPNREAEVSARLSFSGSQLSLVYSRTQPALRTRTSNVSTSDIACELEASLLMEHLNLDVEQNCGTTEPRESHSEALIERMKIVFRKTHGAEMSQEDRNFLGIPPCTGECCP
jgi:hypothetical protein